MFENERWQTGGTMKKLCVSILMMVVFSAGMVSVSFAQTSCCSPGAGCCSNISSGQQQGPVSTAGPSQTKVITAKKPAPQINPMSWSASVNQIGTVRLTPASVSTGCCPGTNSTSACCESDPKSTSPLRPNASRVTEILAVKPFLGTLW